MILLNFILPAFPMEMSILISMPLIIPLILQIQLWHQVSVSLMFHWNRNMVLFTKQKKESYTRLVMLYAIWKIYERVSLKSIVQSKPVVLKTWISWGIFSIPEEIRSTILKGDKSLDTKYWFYMYIENIFFASNDLSQLYARTIIIQL